MLGARYLLSNEFPAAGNLNLMTTDRSSQSLTGRFAHLRRLLAAEALSPSPRRRMARARGCFEWSSRLAASVSTSFCAKPGAMSCSVNFGSPYVSVPVLSKMAVRQLVICSSTAGIFTMM